MFNWLKSDKKGLTNSNKLRTVDFHEDDYCQQELLPVENWFFCARQVGEIEAFSKEHFDGYGWTDIKVREENPKSLSDLYLKLENIEEICARYCQPYEKVTTGYSSYADECGQVKAYGPDKGFTIFIGYDENQIVDSIWFNLWINDEDQAATLNKIFSDINAEKEIMFVDWAWSELFKVSDSEAMRRYIDMRYGE